MRTETDLTRRCAVLAVPNWHHQMDVDGRELLLRNDGLKFQGHYSDVDGSLRLGSHRCDDESAVPDSGKDIDAVFML